MMIDTYTLQPMSLPGYNFYTLWFLKYSPDKIFQTQVTMARAKVKSRSHHDIAYLHPQPMSQPSFNFLHLMVSQIHPRQTFSCHPPTHPDAMSKNNTHTALKGCGVK